MFLRISDTIWLVFMVGVYLMKGIEGKKVFVPMTDKTGYAVFHTEGGLHYEGKYDKMPPLGDKSSHQIELEIPESEYRRLVTYVIDHDLKDATAREAKERMEAVAIDVLGIVLK
jgi:hypothetical protein